MTFVQKLAWYCFEGAGRSLLPTYCGVVCIGDSHEWDEVSMNFHIVICILFRWHHGGTNRKCIFWSFLLFMWWLLKEPLWCWVDHCPSSASHSDLEESIRAAITSCFLVLFLSLWPVLSSRRARSSGTFFCLKKASVNGGCCSCGGGGGCCCGGGGGCCCGGAVDIRATFFAASIFPPSNQNEVSFFSYLRLTRAMPSNLSCLFSTSRRFVAASHRFIFRWKYRRMSSFFFSTPVLYRSVYQQAFPILNR